MTEPEALSAVDLALIQAHLESESMTSPEINPKIPREMDYIIPKFYIHKLRWGSKLDPPKRCCLCDKKRINGWYAKHDIDQVYRHHVYPKETFPEEYTILDVCGSCHILIHNFLRDIKRGNALVNKELSKQDCLDAIEMVTEHFKRVCRFCRWTLSQKSQKCRRHSALTRPEQMRKLGKFKYGDDGKWM